MTRFEDQVHIYLVETIFIFNPHIKGTCVLLMYLTRQ